MKNMKTSVSIIIPIYNSEKTLARCLDSIISSIQKAEEHYRSTFFGEIICVNDGSTDSSETIIADYQKKSSVIKYIAKKNGGSADARNKGIDAASGDYIMFCDSDDEFDSACVKQVVDDIVEYEPAYICFGRTTVYLSGEMHKWSNKSEVHQIDYDGREYLNSYLPYSGHSLVVFNKVYQRQILNRNRIRFDTTLRFGEDVLFNLLYMQNVTGTLLEDFRISYLQHKTEGSLTTTKQSDFFTQNTKCLEALKKTCPDWYSAIEQFVYYYYLHSADLAAQRIISGRDARFNAQGEDYLLMIRKNPMLIQAFNAYDASDGNYLKNRVKCLIHGWLFFYKIRYYILPSVKGFAKRKGKPTV